MIRRENIVPIGKFHKTHALKGELNAILEIEPSYFIEGNPMIILIDGIFVPFYVESIRRKGSLSYLIKLEGVETEHGAASFINKEIFAEKNKLIEQGNEEFIEDDENLIGYTVFDTNNEAIGVISDIDDSTENILFTVEDKDGEIIYIPASEDFIKIIDDEKEIIIMDLPQGLIDLNKKQ